MSEFNPKLKTKVIADAAEASEVVVDTRVAEKTPTPFKITSPERLANAQRRAREYRNPASPLLQFAGEGYYKDYCGADSSEHWFDILHAIVSLIHVPRHFTMGLISYDRQTGEGIAIDDGKKVRVPIAELKAAVKARIVELGLAEYLLWEYITELHTVAEDTAFYATPFEQRITRFKVESAE